MVVGEFRDSLAEPNCRERSIAKMCTGDARRTAILLGAIKALLPQFPLPIDRVGAKRFGPLQEAALIALGEEAFDHAWNLGQRMQVEEVIAMACASHSEKIRS